jgi:hypothetical protein
VGLIVDSISNPVIQNNLQPNSACYHPLLYLWLKYIRQTFKQLCHQYYVNYKQENGNAQEINPLGADAYALLRVF